MLENYPKASFHYQQALQIKPDDPDSLKALSWTYYKTRFYKQALNEAKKVYRKNKKDYQALILLSRILIKINQTEEAQKILNANIDQSPKQFKTYLLSLQGDIAKKHGFWKKAEQKYKKALFIQPLLASALLGISQCMNHKRKYQQAIMFMKRGLRIRPKMTEGYLTLARAYEKIDPKQSIQYYRKFQKLAYGDPELLEQARFVKEKLKYYSKAFKRKKTKKQKKTL